MAARHASHTTLGPTERAVYDLVQRGGIDAAHAALYRRSLLALARAGLITRTPEGHYLAASQGAPATAPAPVSGSGTYTRTAPPAPAPAPVAPPMATLVVRVPQEVLDALDTDADAEPGRTRSDAARDALERGMRAALRRTG